MSLAYLRRRQAFDSAIDAIERLFFYTTGGSLHKAPPNRSFIYARKRIQDEKRAFLFANQEEALEKGDLFYSDTFKVNDCGGFDYTNGFTFPLEETGEITSILDTYHGGQWSALYRLQCGEDFTPSTLRSAHRELERALEHQRDYGIEREHPTSPDLKQYEDACSALESLALWAKGASTGQGLELSEDDVITCFKASCSTWDPCNQCTKANEVAHGKA